MPIMLWDKSLDIGVPDMNREHQEILDLMNRIFDATAAGEGGAMVNALVAKLGTVCQRHFADEEAYMASIGFPALEPHRILHQNLLARYLEFAAQTRADGGRAGEDFFHFLKFWLTSHIKGVDARYATHAHRPAA